MKKFILIVVIFISFSVVSKAAQNNSYNWWNFLYPINTTYIHNEEIASVDVNIDGVSYTVNAQSGAYFPVGLSSGLHNVWVGCSDKNFEVLDNLGHSSLTSTGSAAFSFTGGTAYYAITIEAA